MVEIQKVAIAGATGNLGPHILKELLQAKFDVTILTRSQKSATHGANIRVVEVDFSSMESLTSALKGQDAVVSTVSMIAIEGQKVLIDAAVAAGVKRFIPSDFGVCTTSPKVKALPLYSSLASVRQHLADKATSGSFSYTVLACGSFLEFFLGGPAVVDFDSHAVVLIDGGNNRVSSTSLAGVGKAIVGILKNPSNTNNRVVYVSEVILTQRKVLDTAKEVRPEIEWHISTVQSTALLQEGLEAFASGDSGMLAVRKLLMGTAFGGDQYGSAYDETDNELLGIEIISQDGIKKLITERLS